MPSYLKILDERKTSAHITAFLLFTVLSFSFLGQVLFLDKSLSAFDVILKFPSWSYEYPLHQAQQPILIDSPTAHYPQRQFEWGLMRQGLNASVNPYIFSGMPWVAQGIGGFVTSWPQIFLPLTEAIDWSTAFRLILAGFFMYLLMYSLASGWLPAVFAGVLWTYNLHEVVWLEFPQHLATQLWIPLVFLCNLQLLRNRFSAGDVLMLLLVNFLFATSGYTQIILYTYLFIALFNTLYLLSDKTPWRQRLWDWCRIHALYLFAAMIYGVSFFIEYQILSGGLRGSQQWRGLVTLDSPWWQQFWFVIRDFFPPLSESKRFYNPDYFGGIWQGSYQNPRGNVVESSAYFSVLGVFTVLVAALNIWHVDNRRMRLLLFFLLGLGIAWMYRNPILQYLLQIVPHGSKGSNSRFITLVLFFATALSAFGLRDIERHIRSRHFRSLIAAVMVFFLVPIADGFLGEDYRWPALTWPVSIMAMVSLAAILSLRFAKTQWLMPFLLLVTIADLFRAGIGFNAQIDNDIIFPTNNTIRYLLQDENDFRISVVSTIPLYHPNVLSYYRIPVVEGYSTVLPNRYAAFLKATKNGVQITANGILFLAHPDPAVMRLLNVKYLVTDAPLVDDRLESVLTYAGQRLYRVRDVLPRAWCASDVTIETDADRVFERLPGLISEFDRPVVLETPTGVSGGGDCRLEGINVFVNGIQFTSRSKSRQIVFIPYHHSIHWQAEINGEAATVLRANGAFLALEIPAGDATVRLVHENRLVHYQALVFLVLAILLIIAAVWKLNGVIKWLTVLVATLIIYKSLWSVPGIRNDAIPEKVIGSEQAPVLRQLGRLGDRKTPGKRIYGDQIQRFTLELPERNLENIRILVATYRQQKLQDDVLVTVTNVNRDTSRRLRIPGRRVTDNQWLIVNVPDLSGDGKEPVPFIIELASDGNRPETAYSVWLGNGGEPVHDADYRLDPESALNQGRR